MSDGTLRRLAWIVVGLELVLLAAALTVTVANSSFSGEGWFISVAILMMLGRAPLGRAMSDVFPDLAQWLLDVPSNGGRRAIMMGAAIGAIATGLRVILGLERSHLGSDS